MILTAEKADGTGKRVVLKDENIESFRLGVSILEDTLFPEIWEQKLVEAKRISEEVLNEKG